YFLKVEKRQAQKLVPAKTRETDVQHLNADTLGIHTPAGVILAQVNCFPSTTKINQSLLPGGVFRPLTLSSLLISLPPPHLSLQMKLWNKYKVTSIPSLVFVDAATGKVVCRNGLLVVRDDPKGLEFPWGPKPFAEVVAGPLLRNNRQTADSSCLEGHYVGVYFSAHWCPPCRSLTRVLVESYRVVKESGHKFEIVFVSADRSEESFKQYFSEMPWLAVPYSDEARRSRLNRLYGIQGIPTLILLDAEGRVITRQGRVEVLNDPECRLFPWHPRPVLELSEANAVQLHEGPCLVLFVDAEEEGELEPAKELIQPIAEKLMAKYKAKEEETPLLFFVAGEVRGSAQNGTFLERNAKLDVIHRYLYYLDIKDTAGRVIREMMDLEGLTKPTWLSGVYVCLLPSPKITTLHS
uniref:Nucleoredoxin n=1 Tax=Xiphophorus couchianus TaxID=32473 RepID=A0A3B5MVW1_9TELE